MQTTTLSPDHILQTALGFWPAKTVLSAVELGVFTLLAEGALDLPTATKRLGIHERGARDFLDSLVALKLLRRENGRYSNSPEAALFLDKGKSTYIGGMLEMANARLYGFWGSLTEALRTGRPQNEAKDGKDLFGDLYKNPELLRIFLTGMTGLSAPAAMALGEKFPWAKVKSVIDIGAAQGAVPAHLGRTFPHLTGGGFDLPQVGPIFNDYMRAQGVADRMKFYAGSFFTDPLPQADVLIMGHILHDWDLAQKRALLAKAHAALAPGGSLIIYDCMIDNDRSENVAGLMMSLNMLIETFGGFDYTPADCLGWVREAGFAEAYHEPLLGADSMVVAKK